ncbi:hypothetical protein QQ045_031995 [Rhodiola kirilowii]
MADRAKNDDTNVRKLRGMLQLQVGKNMKTLQINITRQRNQLGKKHVTHDMDDAESNNDDDFMHINKNEQEKRRESSESIEDEDEDGDNLQLVMSHDKPQPKNQHKLQTRYKGFETRITPNTLTEVIISLTHQQKIVVAYMGLEGMLHLRITKVHTQFAHWLLESFDSKTCMLKTPRGDVEILPKDVNYMFGLLMGGRSIKVPLRAIPHELLVQTFRL